ncbi:tropomyosin-like [Hoplias malabaricus]|uniref:tropomyosin-like n=1 Tax=Hoplias malabaricus TaxID=27720 RepID=UPI0034625AC5
MATTHQRVQATTAKVLRKMFNKDIIVHLENGLTFIIKSFQALTNDAVDSGTEQCSNYDYIREQIVKAHQSLEMSENEAQKGLKQLDENIEALTQEEGRLEQEMNNSKRSLESLKIAQTSNEELLKQYENSLRQATDHLRPIMIASGEGDISHASYAIEVAQKEVRSFESEVERSKSKVSEYKCKISQIERNIKQICDQVDQTREKIQNMKKQCESVAGFQKEVRKAVNCLGVLSGRASVAECQTRRFILPEPVMKAIEDVMKAAEDISGNQLLSHECVQKLSDVMEKNRKRAAICYSANNTEDESYY